MLLQCALFNVLRNQDFKETGFFDVYKMLHARVVEVNNDFCSVIFEYKQNVSWFVKGIIILLQSFIVDNKFWKLKVSY